MAKAKEKGVEKAGFDGNGKFAEGNNLGSKIKPGEVRNPKGRRNAISDIIRQAIDADNEKVKHELVNKLIDTAKTAKGDDFLKAFDRIMDRTEGKPTQPTADVSENWQKFLDGVFEAEQG